MSFNHDFLAKLLQASLILGFSLLIVTGCDAAERPAMTFSEEIIVTSNSPLIFTKITDFFIHLDQYYFQLSPDHKKFVLMNSKILERGTLIENEEESGGQFLSHHYKVTDFLIDRDHETLKLVMESEKSTVHTMGFVNMTVKVKLMMDVSKISLNEHQISAVLDIEYKNGFDLFLANLGNTNAIWGTHFRNELENGAKIINDQLH